MHVDAGLLAESSIEIHAVVRELCHRVGAADARDEPRRVPRCPGGDPSSFQEQHVRDPEPGEVVGDRGSGDPASHDQDLGTVGERASGSVWGERRRGEGLVQHPLRHEARRISTPSTEG
jgi:hypothetical protein